MTTPTDTIGLSATLTGTLEDVEATVVDALKEEGFGILTEIDIQGTFKKKLDVDFRPYKILGACNPGLAHRALNASDEVGMLLPCNVTLQQIDDNTVKVSLIDPISMMGVLEHADLKAVADDARERLERVHQALS
jgi:uncharacterized protein (DUF302 family)